MIDDDADNTLGGSYGSGENVTSTLVNLAQGNYTIVLHGAMVTDLLDYNISLFLSEIVVIPATGLNFGDRIELTIPETYSGSLTDYSTWYNNYGHPGYCQYQSSYTGTNWFYFEIPETRVNVDVNITLTFNATAIDMGLWLSEYTWGFFNPMYLYSTAYSDGLTSPEQIIMPGLEPGLYTIFVGQFAPGGTNAYNLTLSEAVIPAPLPISAAVDYTLGNEIIYADSLYTPYNVTLFANTSYMVEIGEPDNWYGEDEDYGNYAGTGKNNVFIYFTNSTGDEVGIEYDSNWEDFMAWLAPTPMYFSPPADGEYTFWIGPYNGLSYTLATFQILTWDNVLAMPNNLNTTLTQAGNMLVNATAETVNMIDWAWITVNSTNSGKLHIFEVTGQAEDDDLEFQNLIIYDSNFDMVIDMGFRSILYAKPWANPSVAAELEAGTYAVCIQGYFNFIDADSVVPYSLDVTVVDAEDVLSTRGTTTGTVDNGDVAYYVIHPSIATRYAFISVAVAPNATSDVKVTLWDLDLQFAREILNAGGNGTTETILSMVDTIDLARDGSMFGEKVVAVESVGAQASFTLTFTKWTPTDLTTATGTLNPANKPNAFYKATVTAGDFVVNFTSWNATSGEEWNAGTENVWLYMSAVTGGTATIWESVSDIELVTLVDGTYFFWIVTGDRANVPEHNYMKNGPYGRCGWPTNLNASYKITFSEFVAPAAIPYSLYSYIYAEDVLDITYSVVLTANVPYYFLWESEYAYGDTVYDAILYNQLGSEVVTGEDGYGPFIYTPTSGGTYKLFLHNFLWERSWLELSIRPLQLVDTHSPDHIVSQWSYEYELENDFYYLLVIKGVPSTTAMVDDSVFVDNYVMPFNGSWSFFAYVAASTYEVDWAGMYTLTLYRSPLHVTTSIVTTTATTTAISSVTEITTVAGGISTVITTTTEGGDGPGFELVVLFAAAVTIFAIRRTRKY